MWFWLVVVAGIVLLVALYRYDPHAVDRDWQDMLSPGPRRGLEILDDQAETDAAMLTDSYNAAIAAQLDNETAEAVYLLQLAMDVVAQALPDRLGRLKAMALCCRMLAAIAPIAPLRPRTFRLRELVTLAGLVGFLEQAMVTAAQRFRLRISFLAWGFRLILPTMRRSGRSIARRPDAGDAWRRFDGAVADFKSLDRAHTEAVRALLLSATALQRTRVVAAR